MEPAETAPPGFYVCHHELNRALPVSPHLVQLAKVSNVGDHEEKAGPLETNSY